MQCESPQFVDRYFGDGYKLSLDDMGEFHWSALPPLPSPVSDAGLCAIGSTLYILGGAQYCGRTSSFSYDKPCPGSTGPDNMGRRFYSFDTADPAAEWTELGASSLVPYVCVSNHNCGHLSLSYMIVSCQCHDCIDCRWLLCRSVSRHKPRVASAELRRRECVCPWGQHPGTKRCNRKCTGSTQAPKLRMCLVFWPPTHLTVIR